MTKKEISGCRASKPRWGAPGRSAASAVVVMTKPLSPRASLLSPALCTYTLSMTAVGRLAHDAYKPFFTKVEKVPASIHRVTEKAHSRKPVFLRPHRL